METVEKTISNLIPDQFPLVYREYGPQYVEFVKKYYEWMESDDQATYHMRRFFEYKDVDETTEELLVYFKEKYLKNIQLDTAQNTRLLIKHSLDLYRSKGTARSIELIFRIVYGIDAKIYYPRKDLFKLSDGKWVIPRYLEVIPRSTNTRYHNRQIRGAISGSTAYVESVIRKKSASRIIDIFYLSNIRGEFEIGEPLLYGSDTHATNDSAYIVGSLNSFNIDITGVGANFEIGDRVTLRSNTGTGGLGRVSEVTSTQGVLSVEMIDGGYGYTNTSSVLLSDKIIIANSFSSTPVRFETISQPMANLYYVNSNGEFESNTSIFTYHANNLLKGEALIISTNIINSSSGRLLVSIIDGNVNSSAIYSESNTVGANLDIIEGYVDRTATANIINVINSTALGVMNVTNQFIVGIPFQTDSGANGTVELLTSGTGANLAVNNLIYAETIAFNTDELFAFANVSLAANTYGFTESIFANAASEIYSALTFEDVTFGKIADFIVYNPGSDYNFVPSITIYEPRSIPFDRKNLNLTITGTSGLFEIGELVTQSATNARGYILSANSTLVEVQNLRLLPENNFVPTTNSTTIIVGSETNETANIASIETISLSPVAGNNANLSVELAIGNGAISGLEVLDSGFGFTDGERVSVYRNNVEIDTVSINLGPIGFGSGFYQRKGGFLSDQKKLFDGHYYQEYSYDIISSLPTDQYRELLKQTTHPAGYALFGTIEHKAINNTTSNSLISYVTQV